MSDNQRYYDIFNNAVQYFEHEGSKVSDQDALDAVIAAVREDLICGAVGAQLIENGRAAAARDIRATPELSGDLTLPMREFYARIAEGGGEQ